MRESSRSQAKPWFVVVLVALISGVIILARAVKEFPLDNPPWLAVVIITAGAAALWIGRSLCTQSKAGERLPDNENKEYGQDSSSEPTVFFPRWHSWRSVAFLLAITLTILVLLRLPRMLSQDSYVLIFMVWGAAILLYLAAVSEPLEIAQWQTWIHTRPWKLILAVVGIVFFAFVFRFWRVGTIPFTLSGDEASQGLEALRVLRRRDSQSIFNGLAWRAHHEFLFQQSLFGFLGKNCFCFAIAMGNRGYFNDSYFIFVG